jgi:hypothetical protein
LNTWLTFTLAIPLKVAQFPVGVNNLMVSCAENNDADWTFGFGKAQFLTGEL